MRHAINQIDVDKQPLYTVSTAYDELMKNEAEAASFANVN